MTDREATMKAYNALHFNLPVIEDYGSKEQLEVQHNAINALDHALAQDEHQFKYKPYGLRADENGNLSIGELPKREWVGLTLADMPEEHLVDRSFLRGARWAEAKLKEKNGG